MVITQSPVAAMRYTSCRGKNVNLNDEQTMERPLALPLLIIPVAAMLLAWLVVMFGSGFKPGFDGLLNHLGIIFVAGTLSALAVMIQQFSIEPSKGHFTNIVIVVIALMSLSVAVTVIGLPLWSGLTGMLLLIVGRGLLVSGRTGEWVVLVFTCFGLVAGSGLAAHAYPHVPDAADANRDGIMDCNQILLPNGTAESYPGLEGSFEIYLETDCLPIVNDDISADLVEPDYLAYLPDRNRDSDADGLPDWYERMRSDTIIEQDSFMLNEQLKKRAGDVIAPGEARHVIELDRSEESTGWTNLTINSMSNIALLVQKGAVISDESGPVIVGTETLESELELNDVSGFDKAYLFDLNQSTSIQLALKNDDSVSSVNVVLIDIEGVMDDSSLRSAASEGSALLTKDILPLDPTISDSDGDGVADGDDTTGIDVDPVTLTDGGEGQAQADLGITRGTILDAVRMITSYIFFTVLLLFITVGVLSAVLMSHHRFRPEGRGLFTDLSDERRYGLLPKGAGPLVIALAAAVSGWVLSLLTFSFATPIERLMHIMPQGYFCTSETGLIERFNYACDVAYIGPWWAIFNTAIVLLIAYLWAERKRTRALVVASGWVLYSISSWQEQGLWTSSILEGLNGQILWFFITFAVFLAVYLYSSNETYGQWAPRDGPGGAGLWWKKHSTSIMLSGAFLVGLAIRIQWNVIPAMNASGTGAWDMTGGSDPWYMKRTIDHILAQHSHFIWDPDRSYPHGGINPRPPLFTWSIALCGMLISSLTGLALESQAIWWALGLMPALYGALTVFPIYGATKAVFDRSSAVLSAWLIALMPGHVSHSTFALADHDAFVVLFISLGVFCFLSAVKEAGSERLVKHLSWRPMDILGAFRAVHRERPRAILWTVLAGLSFATTALGWKGFVYVIGILFLVYAFLTIVNHFRGIDSTALTVVMLEMQMVTALVALPFYGHPAIPLLTDPTGFLPLLFMIFFTLIVAFIAIGFRDRPWLLVVIIGGVVGLGGLVTLYLLQLFNISNYWDVLFTGGGYFTKNKIFGTIAEAQAPSRGVLFGSFGPFVGIFALFGGFTAISRGFRKRRPELVVVGGYVLITLYMAWTAGRFVFNATPAVAIVGAWSILLLYQKFGITDFRKTLRRLGRGTPGARIKSTRKALRKHPGVTASWIIFFVIATQHATYGLDAGIPRGSPSAQRIDATIYEIPPDLLRADLLGFSILQSDDHDGNCDARGTAPCIYLNSFGPGFNSNNWNLAYQWLSQQDEIYSEVSTETECQTLQGDWDASRSLCKMKFGDRPAFVSWWDYGFQALAHGQHPSVSGNFQTGIPETGNMLLTRSEADLLALFIAHLVSSDARLDRTVDDSAYDALLIEHLGEEAYEELKARILPASGEGKEMVQNRVLTVTKSSQTRTSSVTLASGHPFNPLNGAPILEQTLYAVFVNQELIPCVGSTGCIEWNGQLLYMSESDAERVFAERASEVDETPTVHHIIGKYWYTNDLVDEYDTVGTHLHRTNANLALARDHLARMLDTDGLVDLYHDLTTEFTYTTRDTFGTIGSTYERNLDIGYFAVDNRLYPLGGKYTEDAGYHGGNPNGIFHAPTSLAGLDLSHYLTSTYETQTGIDGPIVERTAAEYEEQIRTESISQAPPESSTQLMDIRVDQTDAFFETMVARVYLGYGASTLGLSETSQPSPYLRSFSGGTPGSSLSTAPPLPGAMMPHFVIANWYESGGSNVWYKGNSGVKILRYYTGHQVEGQVVLDGENEDLPMSGVRILVERDAYSGEDGDNDPSVYWIPIDAADVDEDGRFQLSLPAGRIRLTTFVGDADLAGARAQIQAGLDPDPRVDLISDTPTGPTASRTVNPITGVLGGVAGMEWLNETVLIVTGDQALHPEGSPENITLRVSPSGADGAVTWTGVEQFEGDAVQDVTVVFTHQGNNQTYQTTTSNGTYIGERIITGTGAVDFVETGMLASTDTVIATRFSGNITIDLDTAATYADRGTFQGTGWFNGSVNEAVDHECEVNETMPENASVCAFAESSYRLVDGAINGSGRYTADTASTFTKHVTNNSYQGRGIFEGIGTLNGTGQFDGNGTFSGDMIAAGSFYLSGVMPGTYNVTLQFPDGTHQNLTDTIDITRIPVLGTALQAQAGAINASTMSIEGVNPVQMNVTLYSASAEAVIAVKMTDETGYTTFGPLPPGVYFTTINADGDEFEDGNVSLTIGPSGGAMAADMIVVDRLDYHLTLHWANGTLLGAGHDLLVNLPEIDNDMTRNTITTDENGQAHIELDNLTGMTYVITEVLEAANGTSQILTHEFRPEETVVNLSLENAVSVSGQTAFFDLGFGADNNQQAMDAVPLKAKWGNFTLDAFSKDQGAWTFWLPADEQVIITSANRDGKIGAVNLTVVDGLNSILLEMKEVATISGQVLLNNSGAPVTQNYPGLDIESAQFGLEITAVLNNGTGLTTWKIRSNPSTGSFELQIPVGIKDFGLNENAGQGNLSLFMEHEDLNIESAEMEFNITENTGVTRTFTQNLEAHPINVTVHLLTFLDSGLDGSFENGTAVSANLSLIPTGEGHGVFREITPEEYNSIGNLTLDMAPGEYLVSILTQDSDADDALDHQTRLTTDTGIVVGLAATSADLNVSLAPEWMVNGDLESLSVIDGSIALRNKSFRLEPLNDNLSMIMGMTDANGNFSLYAQEGTYILSTEDYEVEGAPEVIRHRLEITPEDVNLRRNISVTALEPVEISLNVVENLTDGEPLDGFIITAVSESGLGNITVPTLDENGNSTFFLPPGDWTFTLNQTNSDVRHLLLAENRTISAAGTKMYINLSAERYVNVQGSVFYDLDGNGHWSTGEGLDNATVIALNQTSDVNVNLTTDEVGSWSFFAPSNTNISFNISKANYTTVEFFRNLTTVGDYNDTALPSGVVTISGRIVDYESYGVDNITLRVIPASGQPEDREPVIEFTTLNGTWTGEWNVTVVPGTYAAYATAPSETGYSLVAVSLVEVQVQVNEQVNLTLVEGGMLNLTAEWVDYNGTTTHLGESKLPDGAEHSIGISLTLSDSGASWNLTLGADNGSFQIALPPGSASVDAFAIINERGRNITHLAGTPYEIKARTEISRVLELNRVKESRVTFEVFNATGGLVASSDTDVDPVPVPVQFVDSAQRLAYNEIILKVILTYEGTELQDRFSITPRAGVGIIDPNAYVYNISLSENGPWLDSIDAELGLDDSTNQSLEVFIRLQFPDSDTAAVSPYDKVVLEARSTISTPSQVEIEFSPETRRESAIRSDASEYYVGRGDSITIPFEIDNLGNSEDLIDFKLDGLPDTWTVNEWSATLEGLSYNNSHSIRVIAPADETRQYYDVNLLANGNDNGATRANLAFQIWIGEADVRMGDLPKKITTQAGETAIIRVPLENVGTIATEDMTIYLNTTAENETIIVVEERLIRLEPGENQTIEFSISIEDSTSVMNTDTNYQVMLDIGATDHVDENEDEEPWCSIGNENVILSDSIHCKQTKISVVAGDSEGVSNWLFIVILLIVGSIVIGVFIRRVQSTPSGPSF